MGKEVENHVSKINNSIDAAVSEIKSETRSSQRGMFSRVNGIAKELEIDSNGNIKTNSNNLRIVERIRDELKDVVVNQSFEKRVRDYVSQFDSLKDMNDDYFKVIAASYEPSKEIFEVIKNNAIESAENSLLRSGLDEQVIKPVRNLLEKNITSGGQFEDLVEELRLEIKGIGIDSDNPERLGRLERYASQIARDSLSQYSANHTKAVTDDLGLEFYYYTAGTQADSRDYCKRREGRYFHKKEVEDSASRRWSGKIPGTSASTIFIYRGGYNCQHQYMPTMKSGVPRSDLERMVRDGYIDSVD